ncbi:Tim44-like domain-containing protein [Sulfuricella sp.]|uniref:Tim44 domain-containing protein n=1 Tax=Sulfuricella sp. TaxID=2099377 RepID=UPI002BC58566|nr:Tim44-like domain-containing protein [Sulfuricella sp.]HUX63194.1 Tim44-like domain-containing protein [Sulfuricella sp.]
MNKFFTLFFVALISFGLTAQNADARRMGGGSSIGKQRTTTTQQTATPPKPASAPAAAPAPAPSGASKWLGPLAGLAAGGLLASMFMGGGMGGLGGGIGNILMILALVGGAFFIFRMLKKPQPQPAQYAGYTEKSVVTDMAAPGSSAAPAAAVQASSTRPAWFEDEPFLREAKKQFIRLQDANDRGDINDIHEYVTPEMYAELSMQIQERNGKPNKTEVVTLNAEIADVVTEGDLVIASVRFSGMIREEANGPAEAFSEIWHIQKSQSQPNATWFISGIQQV